MFYSKKYFQNYFFIILALLFLLPILLPLQARAEITYPYTLDEKPQTLFGDSAQIGTYLGMENYTAGYSGGYAHITFTYTHHQCCFAGYPPLVYITDVDPQTTSTPTERSSLAAYNIPSFNNIATDWYSYDIQFDALGYRVVVKQQAEGNEIFNEYRNIAGLTDTDFVAITNRYPRDAEATGVYALSLAPFSIKEGPVEPEEKVVNPLIVIPGIMGSAYKNAELVIDPILHTYDDLLATFDQNGYTPGLDLFTFPYEWRDSNLLTANLLDDKITEVKNACLSQTPQNIDCSKVDIVAHSMGGLVARAYIQSLDYDSDVDQLIFLGTPHKGSPTDYLQWEAGKFPPDVNNIMKELFFEAEALRKGYPTIFDYIHNRPILSVQELLPIFDYLKDDNTATVRAYPNNYPQNVFLESLNNNISALINSGVEVTNIVGDSGENKTINTIRVIPTDHAIFWQHGEPEGFGGVIGDSGLERGVGDNTVSPTSSALTGFTSEEIVASHNRIPTKSANSVFKILTGNDSVTNIDNGSDIDPKVLILQLLSPIDVVVTAPDGKKIGKNFSSGQEYNEISGAFYSGFQTDDEYITILNPMDGQYKVEVKGTGSGGEYAVLTSLVSGSVSATKEVSGLTLPSQVTTLNVLVNNEDIGETESQKIINSEVLKNDIIKAYDLGWITDKKLKDQLLKKAEGIIKVEKRIEKVIEKLPNGQRKEKRIERLEQRVDNKAALALLVELKGYRKGKINEQAYNIIKEDLEWLLNN
ncbi:MAG TPA: hypothetical protein VJH67_00980 [Candidatus Paceibacterota bacterium]